MDTSTWAKLSIYWHHRGAGDARRTIRVPGIWKEYFPLSTEVVNAQWWLVQELKIFPCTIEIVKSYLLVCAKNALVLALHLPGSDKPSAF